MRPALLVATLLGTIGCGQPPGVGGDDGGDDDAGGGQPDGGPDAVPADAVVPTVPPEVDGRLVINEVMAANALTVLDDSDLASDWVELYNPNDVALSLHGYGFTDDLTDPDKHVFPEGVVVPAGGRVLVWVDDRADLGGTHVSFKLDRKLGEVGVARPDGTWIDRIVYGEQEVDFSAAREPDGSDLWVIEWHPSPGTANPGGDGQPIGLEVPTAPPEQIPAAGDLSERILGYDVILQIGLELPPESTASLLSQPFVYVPGNLVHDGRTYGPVGIRLKGGNSFAPFNLKPSFRINVDEYIDAAKFFGLDDMTLNNLDDDFSMMHERLSYSVMRAAGIPASRANHAMVTVNGQLYGLYTNVETVKREMIARWFDDDQGTLFEATDVDFVAGDIPDYELEFGPDDRSLLTGVANALAISAANAAVTSAGQYADMAQFRRFWAVEAVIAQFDAFPYSIPGDDYFIYADPIGARLHFIPWGMDETFYSGGHDVTTIHSRLAVRCMEAPACFQAWVDQVWEVLDLTEEMDMEAERIRVADQIAPYVIMDTNKPYTNEQVWASQGDLYWFFAGRRPNLETMLPPHSL